MSRKVYLHIGAPKTGTTYLQDRLSVNAKSLAEHGVHIPTTSALVSPGLAQFRAALDLLGQDWGGTTGHAAGSWDALVRRVRRRDGTVVISHEILAPATPAQVAQAMRDLAGSEIHVVYTARDLGRQVPAAWQESVKQGRRWKYGRYLSRVVNGRCILPFQRNDAGKRGLAMDSFVFGAVLFAAACRCLGLPTRFTSGYLAPIDGLNTISVRISNISSMVPKPPGRATNASDSSYMRVLR